MLCPVYFVSSIISHNTSEHEEGTRVDDTGCQCDYGTRTADSKSTEQLGKQHEGTPIHTSRNSRYNGTSRKDDEQIFHDLGDSQLLLEFIADKDSRYTRSYEHIKSHEDIYAQIVHVCRNAGLVIHDRDQARMAQLWGILRDFHVVKALAIHTRDLFNYHCTDLIKLYINIAELQFAEMPTPAGQLNQLRIDLLQHILAANMEEYYDATLTDVEGDTWGSDLETRDPNVKIIFLHKFREHFIVPDGHFALEIVSKAHATAAEITKLSKKVLQSVTTLTKEARWTNKLYTKGARFNYSDMPLLRCIDTLITEINTRLKNNAMSEHVRCLRRTTHN